MHVIGTQVHHHEHNVGPVCSTLAVAEEFRIIHRMEVQALIALEGWILVPDPIHPRHKLLQAMTLLQVPVAALVFFRIEIFLTAFGARARLAEFEGWTIDAIGGTERGGQHQAYEKGRSATVLQILREYIRGVRPQVRAEILTDVRLGQLGEVACDLLLGMAPGKVGVRLCKAALGELILDLRPGEGLRQKNDLRVRGFDLVNQPFPETQWFGVGVVHAQDAHALLDPEADNALEFLPECLPMRRVKVKGVDVLIFLGRIFGVLHGAIRAPPEPLRVLLHIGMIGGALEGDIESYLYPILLGCGDQAPEIVQGPELWMDGRMPAGGRPNGPGTAWIIGGGHGGIVLALAVHLANRMNGRKIENVKTHTRQVGQTCLASLEGTVLAWHRRAGAWKHLIPGAKAGLVTVHHHRELAWGGGGKTAVRIQGHEP